MFPGGGGVRFANWSRCRGLTGRGDSALSPHIRFLLPLLARA